MMKRFRVLEFTSNNNEETESMLNKEIKEKEKIIHFSVNKSPNAFVNATQGLVFRAILETVS